MTEIETKLIEKIRNSSNPEQALHIAINVILDYLKQPQSSVKPTAVDSLEHA